MKKTILLSSLFAAAAAVAGEVVSSNAVAALNKPIDVKAKQTLLAVPFEGYETSGKVKVADIVKTSDLQMVPSSMSRMGAGTTPGR